MSGASFPRRCSSVANNASASGGRSTTDSSGRSVTRIKCSDSTTRTPSAMSSSRFNAGRSSGKRNRCGGTNAAAGGFPEAFEPARLASMFCSTVGGDCDVAAGAPVTVDVSSDAAGRSASRFVSAAAVSETSEESDAAWRGREVPPQPANTASSDTEKPIAVMRRKGMPDRSCMVNASLSVSTRRQLVLSSRRYFRGGSTGIRVGRATLPT